MKATTDDTAATRTAALETLAHLGLDVARLVAFRERYAGQAIPRAVADALAVMLERTADPLLALAHLERLLAFGCGSAAGWDVARWQELLVVLGASQALANWLVVQEARWPEVFAAARKGDRLAAASHVERLGDLMAADWDAFAAGLRRYRHQEYLRIGTLDVLGLYSVEHTWEELSELAAGAVETAYRWARTQMEREFGTLRGPEGHAAEFVVLGMGKLGGRELNFSSDIDLVYLYEADKGARSEKKKRCLPAREYCTRLAEWLTRALQEVTANGFVFRVDLRLRPDGINGPMVNSVSNALLYYESYGQTWERTALLKARPVAGSLELGERFLADVRPFVFRRYLDYATLADMQRMKEQIDSQLGKKTGEYNVKLGRGGIREVEFVVQALQLVHGGRDERVRCRATLEALERLAQYRYLPDADAEDLAQAYRFLRNVEHKIQIVAQRQTHAIPRDEREQVTLARRLGYLTANGLQRFWEDFSRHTDHVRTAFEKLFFQPATQREAAVRQTERQMVTVLGDRESAVHLLREIGFRHPEDSYEHLLFLRDGPPSAPSSPRRRQVLFDLLPSLLAAMRQSPYPDLALQNMASFIGAVGARTSFLLLLRENPATMRMLVQLFATSQFLANQFIRHPELLDSLVRADLVRVQRTEEDMASELHSVLAAAEDFESQLDALRRFRNQEFLRIGINYVQELLTEEGVGKELARLAGVCVGAAVEIAAQRACERFGLRELPGALVVLGLGKLGAEELTFNSDLDLIFVYDVRASSGRTTAHEVFTWWAQRLITVLQVPTKEGIVYRIDTRLRPSGHSGPLVSSLQAFRLYHQESAQVWERQALIKARCVAGDDKLAEDVEAVIEQFVYRAPLTAEEVREIRRLRGRMERELARERADHVNIKTGRGGLVDIEFLVQMLQLHCGAVQPTVRCRATLAALRALAETGVLPPEDAAVLDRGYRFLRRLEYTLRLLHDRPVEDLERHDVDLLVVARRLGFAGSAEEAAHALWQAYGEQRETIRQLYEQWFDRAEQGRIRCGGA